MISDHPYNANSGWLTDVPIALARLFQAQRLVRRGALTGPGPSKSAVRPGPAGFFIAAVIHISAGPFVRTLYRALTSVFTKVIHRIYTRRYYVHAKSYR